MSGLAVGVDLGGTNARAALVEMATGRVLKSVRRTHDDRAVEAVAQSVALVVREARGDAKTSGVGVGVAGQLGQGGVVAVAPNLGWRDADFGGLLAKALGEPVQLMNDLKVAAWGEFKAGAARGTTDMFTVFVGSGVGGAQISGGRLVTGGTRVGGELGHVKVVLEGGRPCGCGEVGCLEAYAGGHNLEAWMKEEGLEGTPADLERLALQGHSRARVLWEFASGAVGLAVANVVTLLNPQVVVLGGGVLRACPAFRARVVQVVEARAGRVALAATRFVDAQLGDDSGVVGAALLSA